MYLSSPTLLLERAGRQLEHGVEDGTAQRVSDLAIVEGHHREIHELAAVILDQDAVTDLGLGGQLCPRPAVPRVDRHVLDRELDLGDVDIAKAPQGVPRVRLEVDTADGELARRGLIRLADRARSR